MNSVVFCFLETISFIFSTLEFPLPLDVGEVFLRYARAHNSRKRNTGKPGSFPAPPRHDRGDTETEKNKMADFSVNMTRLRDDYYP